MGSLMAELRRFEKRRLRPLVRRLKPRRPRSCGNTTTNEPMEQLLAALLRAEIRGEESQPTVRANPSSQLGAWLARHRSRGSNELESLVRAMLATTLPAAAREPRRQAA